MNNTMISEELVRSIARKMDITEYMARKFLLTFSDTVNDNAANGVSTKISGIGTIEVSDAPARRSIDISTKKEMIIPPHHIIRFKPSAKLRRAVKDE